MILTKQNFQKDPALPGLSVGLLLYKMTKFALPVPGCNFREQSSGIKTIVRTYYRKWE